MPKIRANDPDKLSNVVACSSWPHFVHASAVGCSRVLSFLLAFCLFCFSHLYEIFFCQLCFWQRTRVRPSPFRICLFPGGWVSPDTCASFPWRALTFGWHEVCRKSDAPGLLPTPTATPTLISLVNSWIVCSQREPNPYFRVSAGFVLSTLINLKKKAFQAFFQWVVSVITTSHFRLNTKLALIVSIQYFVNINMHGRVIWIGTWVH